MRTVHESLRSSKFWDGVAELRAKRRTSGYYDHRFAAIYAGNGGRFIETGPNLPAPPPGCSFKRGADGAWELRDGA